MNLKPTLFDILLNQKPFIYECIQKDISIVNEKKLNPPFGNTDEFSVYFSAYLDSIIKELISITKDNLLLEGKGCIPHHEIENYVRAEAQKDIGFFAHAEYLSLFNFIYFGEKAFYFDNKLIEHLAYTKLDAPSELILPPFDSCLFVLTSPIAIKSLFNLGKNQSHLDLETPINVFISNRPSDEGLRSIVFACWQVSHKSRNIFIKRELLVRKEWSIDKMLKTDWRDIYRDFSKDEVIHDESIFYNEGLLFFHILINCILYLGSNEPDIINVLSNRPQLIQRLKNIKSPAKRKKMSRKIDDTSSLNFNYVGENVGEIIVQKPNYYKKSDSSLGIKFRDKRFLVRGHWRHQHYGEENINTKLIWIRPYFKGPEMAQLINKPYRVK